MYYAFSYDKCFNVIDLSKLTGLQVVLAYLLRVRNATPQMGKLSEGSAYKTTAR